MTAVQEAITYCLNRYIDQTRRLGISGSEMRKQMPDELKRFDPKDGEEQPETDQPGGDTPVVETDPEEVE